MALAKIKVGMIVYDQKGGRWKITSFYFGLKGITHVRVMAYANGEILRFWHLLTKFLVDFVEEDKHNWLHEGF